MAKSDVFINAAFDAKHEKIFLAMIAGLVSLGLNPRCVLEIPPAEDRLRRLHQILRECPFSIHDLSRVQTSQAGLFRVPRFNMPFELGLAAAVSFSKNSHGWRVLESAPFRVTHSLSDIAGYDALIHYGTVEGTLEALLDIFDRLPSPPLSELRDLSCVYAGLRRFQRTLPSSVFRPRAFRKLVLAARALTDARVAATV